MSLSFLPTLTGIAAAGAVVIFVIRTFVKMYRTPPARNPKLDKAGLITNIILGLFYIPFSLFGSLFGMVGEGYMFDDPSFAQATLCHIIEFLCPPFTPMVIASIVLSFTMRAEGKSKPSFLIQFTPLVYFALMLALALPLDFL